MEQGRAKEEGLAPRSRGVCDLGLKPHLGLLYRLTRVLIKPGSPGCLQPKQLWSSGGTWILGSQDLGSGHQFAV